jgi:hypothetical protein
MPRQARYWSSGPGCCDSTHHLSRLGSLEDLGWIYSSPWLPMRTNIGTQPPRKKQVPLSCSRSLGRILASCTLGGIARPGFQAWHSSPEQQVKTIHLDSQMTLAAVPSSARRRLWLCIASHRDPATPERNLRLYRSIWVSFSTVSVTSMQVSNFSRAPLASPLSSSLLPHHARPSTPDDLTRSRRLCPSPSAASSQRACMLSPSVESYRW